MAAKDNTGRIILFMVGGGFLSVVALVGWLIFKPDPPVPQIDIDGYKPSSEFAFAYNALSKAAEVSEAKNVDPEPAKEEQKPADIVDLQIESDATSAVEQKPETAPAKEEPLFSATTDRRPSDFNLERTFRIIRGLDIAQAGGKGKKACADWMSFLRYMANQDYRGVPAEVIEAQAGLLPILDRIREIEADIDDHSGGMAVLKAVGVGANEAVNNMDEGTMANLMSFALPPAAAMRAMSISQKSVGAAIANYNVTGAKRRQIERQLKEVQFAYFKFLAKYVPIRVKYEKEWNDLCLAKDKMHIQVGAASWESAANTAKEILEQYPHDRESAVLRALSLSRMALADARAASEKQAETTFMSEDGVMKDIGESVKTTVTLVPKDDPRIVEAGAILAKYINEHPDSAAPALIVGGLIRCMTGDMRGAMESLDQSSIEYPREAGRLADMLEAYASRPYLEKTAEGQRLLRMHRSLCEGFGAFSPNLEKAFVYEREGEFKKAQEEIFNHFFRRTNQESIHELVSDMDFCERNLSVGFKGLLMEHAYLDVDFEQVRNAKTLGMTTKDDEIKVSLHNRADIELRNVRLFLCVQFTEMYKGEYDIIKVGSVGVLKPGEKYAFPAADLGRDSKEFKDISNVRAIVMTDDKICWVDTVRAKRSHAINISSGVDWLDLPFTVAEYLSAFGLSPAKIASMARAAPVLFESKMWPKSDVLEISFPRIFAALDPIFTIGEIGSDGCVYPEENRVAGTKITLRFPVKLKDSETCNLCVYSDYLSFRITLKREGKNVSIAGVAPLERLKKN